MTIASASPRETKSTTQRSTRRHIELYTYTPSYHVSCIMYHVSMYHVSCIMGANERHIFNQMKDNATATAPCRLRDSWRGPIILKRYVSPYRHICNAHVPAPPDYKPSEISMAEVHQFPPCQHAHATAMQFEVGWGVGGTLWGVGEYGV